ncbi:MAG TPA: hypothetical protein VKK79_00570 [Candidatus Lokiarchaeia archaeon]|nr:hypothetical protein [Candidatus Lokiarchaeia archaeon]
MATEFLANKDFRWELQQKQLLPREFLDALTRGIYPQVQPSYLSPHVENYGDLVLGHGYLDTIIVYGYCLVLAAVQGAACVSIHSAVEGDNIHILGTIEYVTRRKNKRSLKYPPNFKRQYPQGYEILLRAREEIEAAGFPIDVPNFTRTTAPFAGSAWLNSGGRNILWKKSGVNVSSKNCKTT